MKLDEVMANVVVREEELCQSKDGRVLHLCYQEKPICGETFKPHQKFYWDYGEPTCKRCMKVLKEAVRG